MTIRPSLRHRVSSLAIVAGTLLAAGTMHAASTADDNAGNYGFNAGDVPYNTGSNQGVGFQPFILANTGSAGNFLAQNTGNSQINTPGDPAKVFALFGFDGGVSSATRPFTGALSVGQSFSLDLDLVQFVDNNTSLGFSLADAGGAARFTFSFVGGENQLSVTDGGGRRFIGANGSFATLASGVRVVFTLTGLDTYSVTSTGITDGNTDTTTGILAGLPGNGLDRAIIFDNNAGANNDVLFNNMAIVPEPSTYACVFGGLTLLVGLQRRRARRAQMA